MKTATVHQAQAGATETRRRAPRWWQCVVAVGLATGLATPAAAAQAASQARQTPASGIEAFAGDVFQLGSNGNLIAVDPRTVVSSAALYNLEGDPLGETWGQFSAATASSLASIVKTPSDDATDLRITLSGLFANGVYSLFYQTFAPNTVNPVCPTIDPTIALTARHPKRQQPDASSFIAGSSGRATFDARVAGDLLNAQEVNVFVVYHFNGQVYGAVPNSGEASRCSSTYGADAIRQFIILQKYA
jgi:hypothetical protein